MTDCPYCGAQHAEQTERLAEGLNRLFSDTSICSSTQAYGLALGRLVGSAFAFDAAKRLEIRESLVEMLDSMLTFVSEKRAAELKKAGGVVIH